MANLTVPATGATILKDTVEGGDVFPAGGLFFGPAAGLERVTDGNPLPVVQTGTLTASGEFTMSGPLPAGANLIGSVKPTVSDPLTTTDASGTIAAGGTAQTLFAANSARRGVLVTNLSAGDLYINELAAAANGVGHPIAPGKTLILDGIWAPVTLVSIWGATTGQAFTARSL